LKMEEDVGLGSGDPRQRRYTAEFRRDAVALWRRSGKSIAEVARELGVKDVSLGLWIKQSDVTSPMIEQEEADRAEAARLGKRIRELEEAARYWCVLDRDIRLMR
jgi:transposase